MNIHEQLSQMGCRFLLTICNLVKLEKKLKTNDLFRVLTCDGELEKDLLQKTFKKWKDLSLFKEENNLIKFSNEKSLLMPFSTR